MSQFYPQQTPSFPPPRPPENDDYYDEGDYEYEVDEDDYEDTGSSLVQYALAFLGGGCLVFICMSCCFLLVAGLWMLDSTLASTPMPGSDIGVTTDDPARVREEVVNDQNVQLTLLEVNRNASLPTVPVVEGRELIIVTVELVNLNTEEEIDYSERDFLLINTYGDAYQPMSGQAVVDGALDRGVLRSEEGLDGRLVFEVLANEPELTLEWRSPDSEPRYVSLR
ncbi:MAG: DUF4352 domain-containing protein [Anaerolineae bacterium]|nr:DUF4352 domain-containing protein [Anaerolineae bacterium]